MVEGQQNVFTNRNTRVNLLILAQDFEYDDNSSGNDDDNLEGDNDDDNLDADGDDEPPDDDQNGVDNHDADANSEPDISDNSNDNSSSAVDNHQPNGHGNVVAPHGDDNDNIEPEFIPINGVYQNGYMFHLIESYHNQASTRYRDDNLAEERLAEALRAFGLRLYTSGFTSINSLNSDSSISAKSDSSSPMDIEVAFHLATLSLVDHTYDAGAAMNALPIAFTRAPLPHHVQPQKLAYTPKLMLLLQPVQQLLPC
ncbi:secreted acidic protein 2-like [Chenopodium quinoa]|uniref:secreted acidic protein 2-like n=1 Tax=Chenopodium quinoa TaxID=63459 RepID=UPI000B79606D|nr:secreted acidic protein 2-like [Chenopodium quinoa]